MVIEAGDGAAVSEFVERLVDEIRTLRRHRSSVLRDAYTARARARSLRRSAAASREVALVHRWQLWSAGLITEAPSMIPDSWRVLRDVETLLDDAALECLDCRDATAAFRGLAVVCALAGATAGHLLERSAHHTFLLGATARVIDELEPTLDATSADAVVCASAMRRCRKACREALLAASS